MTLNRNMKTAELDSVPLSLPVTLSNVIVMHERHTKIAWERPTTTPNCNKRICMTFCDVITVSSEFVVDSVWHFFTKKRQSRLVVVVHLSSHFGLVYNMFFLPFYNFIIIIYNLKLLTTMYDNVFGDVNMRYGVMLCMEYDSMFLFVFRP